MVDPKKAQKLQALRELEKLYRVAQHKFREGLAATVHCYSYRHEGGRNVEVLSGNPGDLPDANAIAKGAVPVSIVNSAGDLSDADAQRISELALFLEEVDAAKRKLLAADTGTPAHWLSVISDEMRAEPRTDETGDYYEGVTLSYGGVAAPELERTRQEIRVAILRLETEPDAEADKAQTDIRQLGDTGDVKRDLDAQGAASEAAEGGAKSSGQNDHSKTADGKREQLEALEQLADLYASILRGKHPGTFPQRALQRAASFESKDGRLSQAEAARRSALAKLGRLAADADEARRRLVASGYPVPDNWLTVRVTGRVRLLSPAEVEAETGETGQGAIDYEGADMEGLRDAVREIHAAMLRLDAEPAIAVATAEGADGKRPRTDYLSLSEVADICDKSKARISQLCKSGDIRCVRGKDGKVSTVSLTSAQAYFANAEREKLARTNAKIGRDARKDARQPDRHAEA